MAPLRVASLLGLLLAMRALFCSAAAILWETLLFGQDVPGYPSLVVGLMVIGGVQLIMIGIVGEYIGKLLSEMKARPIYFVAEHSVKNVDIPQKKPQSRGRRPRARRSKPNVRDGRPPDMAVRGRLRHFPLGQRRHS